MKAWVQDSAIAAVSLVVFIISILVLPGLMGENTGFAIILAIAIFIVVMSLLGYRIEDTTA
jgi:hypothetical protein